MDFQKMITALEKYLKIPLAADASGAPLLVTEDDHNISLLVQKMKDFGDAVSVQKMLDTIQTQEFRKQLHWQVVPGWIPPQAPVETQAPPEQKPKDERGTKAKLRDLGIFVDTSRVTREDRVAQENKREADRQSLRKMMDTDQCERQMRSELRDINLFTIAHMNRISIAATHRERERQRIELRKKYADLADKIITPDGEKSTTF